MGLGYRDYFTIIAISEDEFGNSDIARIESNQCAFYGRLSPLSNLKMIESQNVGDNVTHVIRCHYDDVADLLDINGTEYWLTRETNKYCEKYRIRSASELQNERREYELAVELIKREAL